MSTRAEITVSFLGGASEIGASCALVRVADASILIDAGVRFRAGDALPDLDRLTGGRLDAVVVTHAHSDHTGALPVVHDAFPATPIYMTPPTIDLVAMLQRDALKIMNAPGEREDDIPLYTERQVERMAQAVRPVHHHAGVTVGDVVVTWLPASHIVGASMVHLHTPGGDVLFTGDYSVTPQRSVEGLARPALHADMIVSEATYGDRMHADRKLAEARLVRTVSEVLEGGGRVLIPAFAIGRAQEVLLILKDALRRGQMPEVPVFVDGMVRAACGVYGRHERYLSRALSRAMLHGEAPFFTGTIRAVARPEDRRAALDAGPCVIVASSGMLRGGPSALYAAELCGRPEDAVLITGYQDEESPGRALLDLAARQGPRRIRLGDREVDVRCRFEAYSLSAHADRMQMMGLIESLRAETVVLVHGDRDAKLALTRSLGARDVVLGEDGASVRRSYRARTASKPSAGPPPLRRESALALLGSASKEPLRADALAAAWFGHDVGARDLERFVEALVDLGAARRDDEDRALLWSLAPAAREPEEGPDAATAQRLKAENPKGRLLELCARRRLSAPVFTASSPGGAHAVDASIDLGDRVIASGPRRASSKKLAEQLAAESLLAQLDVNEALAPDPALSPPPVPAPTPGASYGDARAQLNEMRQLRLIGAYGYETVDRRGPSHQPVFVMRGWVDAVNGERAHTDAIDASSRRAGEATLAPTMLALAVEFSSRA